MTSLDCAKLVLGYLSDQGLEKTKTIFCQECVDLDKSDVSKITKNGNDHKLPFIIEEYAVLKGYEKLSQLDPEDVVVFLWKQFDVLVGQLKHSTIHALKQQKTVANFSNQGVRVRHQNRLNRVNRQRKQKLLLAKQSCNVNIKTEPGQTIQAPPLNGAHHPKIMNNPGFPLPPNVLPSLLIQTATTPNLPYNIVPTSTHQTSPPQMRFVPLNQNIPPQVAVPQYRPVQYPPSSSMSSMVILPLTSNIPSSTSTFQPSPHNEQQLPQNASSPSSVVIPQVTHSSPVIISPQCNKTPSCDTLTEQHDDSNYLKIHIPSHGTTNKSTPNPPTPNPHGNITIPITKPPLIPHEETTGGQLIQMPNNTECNKEHLLSNDQFKSPKRKSAPPHRRHVIDNQIPETTTTCLVQSPLKQSTASQDALNIENLLERILGQPEFPEKLAENINRAVELEVPEEVESLNNESSTTVVNNVKVDNILDMMKLDPMFEQLFNNFESDENKQQGFEKHLPLTEDATDALLLLANSPIKFLSNTTILETPEKSEIQHTDNSSKKQITLQTQLHHKRQLDFENTLNDNGIMSLSSMTCKEGEGILNEDGNRRSGNTAVGLVVGSCVTNKVEERKKNIVGYKCITEDKKGDLDTTEEAEESIDEECNNCERSGVAVAGESKYDNINTDEDGLIMEEKEHQVKENQLVKKVKKENDVQREKQVEKEDDVQREKEVEKEDDEEREKEVEKEDDEEREKEVEKEDDVQREKQVEKEDDEEREKQVEKEDDVQKEKQVEKEDDEEREKQVEKEVTDLTIKRDQKNEEECNSEECSLHVLQELATVAFRKDKAEEMKVVKRKLIKNKRQNKPSKKMKTLPADLDVDKFLSKLHYAGGKEEM